jgi:hypothetical protein
MKKMPVKVSENTTIYVEVDENELEGGNEEIKVARGGRLSFDSVLNSIKDVSEGFCKVLERVSPSKATVELGFDVSFKEGVLISTLVNGSSKAGIKVTLEWEKKSNG